MKWGKLKKERWACENRSSQKLGEVSATSIHRIVSCNIQTFPIYIKIDLRAESSFLKLKIALEI